MLECIQCRCRCQALLCWSKVLTWVFFYVTPTANHQKSNTALSKYFIGFEKVFIFFCFSDWLFTVAVNVFFQHFIQCKDYSDSCFRSGRNLDSHHCGLYSVFTVILATISQTILFHFISLLLSFSPQPQNCILLCPTAIPGFCSPSSKCCDVDHWESLVLFTNSAWDTEKS